MTTIDDHVKKVSQYKLWLKFEESYVLLLIAPFTVTLARPQSSSLDLLKSQHGGGGDGVGVEGDNGL